MSQDRARGQTQPENNEQNGFSKSKPINNYCKYNWNHISNQKSREMDFKKRKPNYIFPITGSPKL